MSMAGLVFDSNSGWHYSRRAVRGRSMCNLLTDSTYGGSADGAPELMALRVLNPEYRIIKAKERMYEKFPAGEKQLSGMMKNFLSAANGSSSYSVKIDTIFDRLKESGNPENTYLVPVTLIACKIEDNQVYCSVERLFYEHNNGMPPKQALRGSLYFEHTEQIIQKFRNLDYQPIGVIGKGDFTRPLSKVFGEQFGFVLS
nr:hypothetical protein [uncultured Caproiciproducens sp.]